MNTRTLLATLALSLTAAASHAQSLSREDVAAELARARAAGELDHAQAEVQAPGVLTVSAKPAAVASNTALPRLGTPVITRELSREQVIAELARARAEGDFDRAEEELGLVTVAGSQRQARNLARSQASADTAVAGSAAPASAR